MRANPGGEIASEEVIGRDRLIQHLWQALERQSIILTAERRMGKSTVVKKMKVEAPEGMLTFYRDVENIDSPIGFVERIYHDLQGHLSHTKQTAGKLNVLMKQLAGIELAGLVKFPEVVAPHWKTLLEKTIEDLTEHQDRIVVLFWDELPLMLQKIKRVSGETTAMDVLDTLRGLRQMHSDLRMVYTGSIGLHHITTVLKDAGHANDATNDMRTIEVTPLSEHDAQLLAIKLLHGEHLQSEDPEATARVIAEQVDCHPFYIHGVVSSIVDKGDVVSGELVKQIVAKALVDPQDAWHLQHYRDRLKKYYGEDQLPVVLFLLDELAVVAGSLTFDDLQSSVAAHLQPQTSETTRRILDGDSELLRRILMLLQRDHYVQQQPEDGTFRFRFPLIQRWWRIHRNLS